MGCGGKLTCLPHCCLQVVKVSLWPSTSGILVATHLVFRPQALAIGVVSCPEPAVIALIGVTPVCIAIYRLSHHDLEEGEDGALGKTVDES